MSRAAAAKVAAPERQPEPSRPARRQVQAALAVSRPADPAEREAESVARAVMATARPTASARVGLLAQRAPTVAPTAPGTAPAATEAEIRGALAGGNALPAPVRAFVEPRFRADFSRVRIHTDAQAAKLSTALGARAFTYGRHIFFNAGQYAPDTRPGMELIAHELTHTIQQSETVQRDAVPGPVAVHERAESQAQRLSLSDIRDWFADKANFIPGFRLITIVIGVNPINGRTVERSGANILRALVEFLPGGGLIVEALDRYGVFDKAGAWIEAQFASLAATGAAIMSALHRFLDSLGIGDLFSPGDVWERAKQIFIGPIQSLIAFGRGLVAGVIQFVKDAILKPLAEVASRTPAWDLLCAVLGRNPITGEAVPRTAETLIGGFMKMIGQSEIWENIKRANAIARAWAWFQGALNGLMALVTSIPDRFMTTLRSLEIMDLVVVPRAFAKVGQAFASFAGDFLRWAGGTVLDLLTIILEVVAPAVVPYLKKAAGAFQTIVRNPIGFVRTLVAAAMRGFRQFAANFLGHLRASLVAWLTGAMEGANIYIPQGFNLREILKFAMSVMGLTWANVRGKLVRATSEPVVKALETGFDLVRTLVTEGPAAAWQKIVETLTNLKDLVIEQVMAFVKSRVVEAAVTKLLSLLSPAGAFIQAIIAIYNTVMFFVERLRQIAQVAASFIDSLATIAAGNIAPAAARVETTMAGLLTLVISFLARIAGLGKVADAVRGVIDRVRAPIDKALDRVVAWIVEQARKLGRFVAQAGVPHDPNERLRLAAAAAGPVVRALGGRGAVSASMISAALAAIKFRYALSAAEPLLQNGEWWLRLKINPEVLAPSGLTTDLETDEALDPQTIWDEVVANAETRQTKLSLISTVNARRNIVAVFASGNVPAGAADTALKAIDALLKAALEESTGDGITNRMASVAGVSNRALALGGTGTVLNAHHVQQVARNRATFPATAARRQTIPTAYKRAIAEWVKAEKKRGIRGLKAKKDELVGLLRQQLSEDRDTRTKSTLENVDMIVATAVSHRDAHSAMTREARAAAALRITARQDG